MLASGCHLLLALVCLCAGVGQAFLNHYGVVTPRDPFKFVGEDLVLFCNITDPNLRENSSMLEFKHTAPNGQEYLIPKKYIEILTSKAIRLNISGLTLQSDGNYVCFQRLHKKIRKIGFQRVVVDNKPKRIESIDCLVYNWENMTCKWSLGVHFQHPQYVDVMLTWVTRGQQHQCPNMTDTSCGWPASVYQHGKVYYIMILVVKTVYMNRTLYKEVSPQFKIETDHYDTHSATHKNGSEPVKIVAILKPAPIRDLQAEETSSTCINLSWTHPSSKRIDKTYDGTYEIAGSGDRKEIDMSQLETHDVKISLTESLKFYYRMTITVCGLTPFTDYTFNISVLPYPKHSSAMKAHGYRSDWVSVPAKTREDVPGIPPPICQSCFHIHECSQPRDGLRCVRIYWGDTPRPRRHGQLVGYAFNFSTSDVTSIPLLPPETNVGRDVTNARFQMPNTACEVLLKSRTSEGLSPEPSTILIPGKGVDEARSLPTGFLVEKDDVTFHLSWELPSHSLPADSNITVVWCTAGEYYDVCKGYIQWKLLPSNASNYPLVTNGPINVGVATETIIQGRRTGSGIRWASCIYHKNQTPKRLEGVRFAKNPPVGGLIVKWKRPDCAVDKAFITGYKVTICITQDGIKCFGQENTTEGIKRTATDYTFLKLNSTENYLVTLAARSRDGKYGPPSLSKNATVKPFKKNVPPGSRSKSVSEPLIVVVVVFSFILMVSICIGGFLCARCIKRRKDKFPIDRLSSSKRRNAESMNRGSSSRNTGNESVNSVNEGLNGGIHGTVTSRDYHYLIPKEDRDSNTTSGISTDVGDSLRSASSHESEGNIGHESEGTLYSKEQTDNYLKIAMVSGRDESGSGSEGRCLHEERYPIPVTSPDSAIDVQSSTPFFQDGTVLRRPHRGYASTDIAKGDFSLGHIKDKSEIPFHTQPQEEDGRQQTIATSPTTTTQQRPETSNGRTSPSKPPKLPTTSPPPRLSPSTPRPMIPPREPYKDTPPPNNAPPIPNTQHPGSGKQWTVPSDDIPAHPLYPIPNPHNDCDKRANNLPSPYTPRKKEIPPSINGSLDYKDDQNNIPLPPKDFEFQLQDLLSHVPPPSHPPPSFLPPQPNICPQPTPQPIITTNPSQSHSKGCLVPAPNPQQPQTSFHELLNSSVIHFEIDPMYTANGTSENDDVSI